MSNNQNQGEKAKSVKTQGGIFSGRLNRARFMVRYFLFSFVCSSVAGVITLLLSGEEPGRSLSFVVMFGYLFLQATWVVKRLHDINQSGLFYWIMFVPFANLILLIMLLVTKGTEGPNKYGEDPLAEESRGTQDEKDWDAASFCPECKAQYTEGPTTCSDCGIPLQRFFVGSMGQAYE